MMLAVVVLVLAGPNMSNGDRHSMDILKTAVVSISGNAALSIEAPKGRDWSAGRDG